MRTSLVRALVFFVVLPMTSLLFVNSPRSANTAVLPTRLFDEYGLIRWEDEHARLDNFAIQVTNESDSIGYIFVYDGENVCVGEAQARAVRAKNFIVEHRGVPWNRVIWRHDGYAGEFRIVLQPASRSIPIPYPFMGPFKNALTRHVTKNCKALIAEIKRSKWN